VDEARKDPIRLTPSAADDFVPLLESDDPAMRPLLEKAKRAAISDATILLTGESGTGKDVLARQIHRWSSRAECPFITVHCTSRSENLLESELFGHMRGAFDSADKDERGLLEAAHGGSILFDEISDLTVGLQTKLLHFLKHDHGRPTNHRCVEPRPGFGSCGSAIPRGSLLSAWRDKFAGSCVARASRRHSALGDAHAGRRHRPQAPSGSELFSRGIIGADLLSMARKYPRVTQCHRARGRFVPERYCDT
jgi:Sigma-54 interaction domain